MGCAAAPEVPAPAVSGATQVVARDNVFRPERLRARVGEEVLVQLRNVGQAPHTFTIAELGVDLSVGAGRSGTVSFAPARRGPLRFVCTYHLAAGMTGTVDVE